MGCGSSKPETRDVVVKKSTTEKIPIIEPSKPVPEVISFSYDELSLATNNFSGDFLADGSDQSRNLVYKGQLEDGKFVAIKKLREKDWPDAAFFMSEATKISKIQISGLVRCIGFCNEAEHRLLVSEYMPNSTLARKLFHWEEKPMEWYPRLNAAIKSAQVLIQLQSKGFISYHDLNAYRILFDDNNEPRLSCFGLIKHVGDGDSYSSNLAFVPPEYLALGMRKVTAESIVFSFGTVLVSLLSGKSIRPNHFTELVEKKSNLNMVIDSNLLGRTGLDSATAVLPLAAKCLHPNPKERPNLTFVLRQLEALDQKDSNAKEVNGDLISHSKSMPSSSPPRSPSRTSPRTSMSKNPKVHLSDFARASHNCDFKSLHEMLVKEVYGTPTQEVSFEYWTAEMQEKLSARKRGDQSFKAGRWQEAIALYTHFTELGSAPLPLMFARRCVSYLQVENWQAALSDAMTAQFAQPEWPEAYFLQVAALKMLGLMEDADEKLNQGVKLEQQITAELEAGAAL